jgi:hypothetical protein
MLRRLARHGVNLALPLALFFTKPEYMDMTASKFPSCSIEKEDLEGVFVKSVSACQQPFLSGIILSILSLKQRLCRAVLLRRDTSAPLC